MHFIVECARWQRALLRASMCAVAMFGSVGCATPASLRAQQQMSTPASPAPISSTSSSVRIFAGLSAELTYESGQLSFKPPASTDRPVVTADQAYENFMATGIEASAAKSVEAETLLALMTNHVRTTTDTEGKQVLIWADHLVWLVRFHNVPVYPAGGGAVAGSPSVRSEEPVIQDVIAPIDAATGEVLFVSDTTIDPRPMPYTPRSSDPAKSAVTAGG